MKILFTTSEAAPFAKTGGLADVAGSLPVVLAKAGHDVRVVMPLYESIGADWRAKMKLELCDGVQLAWRRPYIGIFSLEHEGVTFYFIDNEYYFKRAEIYGHFDDGERFAYFSRAVIELPKLLDFAPDILHANDWQTALVPIYLLEEKYRIPQLAKTKSVFTIHNIEYQGRYGKELMNDLFGLSMSYCNEDMMAFYDDVNLLKGAINAADFVTTVSPTYAQELKYPFYGKGLDGVIRASDYKLKGILNGIDVELYHPGKDAGIAKNYTAGRPAGKKLCKAALQETLGLRVNPEVPILAIVSRLVKHKGIDLVAAGLHRMMDMDIQMVVLGTGDWNYEEMFRQAASQYPGRFAAQLMYSAHLSSAIYAGADMFLMPSTSEPCGLSQMIAMRYGTVPVVRETGGLRDSVTPFIAETGEGTGFTFADINLEDMMWVLGQAANLYHEDRKTWNKLVKNAMQADFSWDKSAAEYIAVYEQLL